MSRGKQKVWGYNTAMYNVPMSSAAMGKLEKLGEYVASRPDICPVGKVTDKIAVAIAFAVGVEQLEKEAKRDGFCSGGEDEACNQEEKKTHCGQETVNASSENGGEAGETEPENREVDESGVGDVISTYEEFQLMQALAEKVD
jgi:hypothetical protein